MLAPKLFGGALGEGVFMTLFRSIAAASQSAIKPPYKMVTSSYSIPHPEKEKGEDAVFESSFAVGVADGVGGWRKQGIDPGLYSRELVSQVKKRVTKPIISQKELMDVVTNATTSTSESIRFGSSTLCALALGYNKNVFFYNIGDSGLFLFRFGLPEDAISITRQSLNATHATSTNNSTNSTNTNTNTNTNTKTNANANANTTSNLLKTVSSPHENSPAQYHLPLDVAIVPESEQQHNPKQRVSNTDELSDRESESSGVDSHCDNDSDEKSWFICEYSPEQLHGFNFPYQLGASGDQPSQGVAGTLHVEPGDICVIASDGLFDNIWPKQLTNIFNTHLSHGVTALPQPQQLREVVKAIVNTALQCSCSDSLSPFAYCAHKAGLKYAGGKPDDISVVVAVFGDPDQEQKDHVL